LRENFDRFNSKFKEKEMVSFRRVILAMAVLALFTGLATAQVFTPGGGPGSAGGNLTCSVLNTGNPTQVRSEGYAELLGDIVIQCTGGSPVTPGGAVPLAKNARNVEIGFKHATELNLGPQDNWVFEPATDKQIKFEALTGELKRGGTLSGKVTGAIAGQKPPFSWDLQFDLVLPQRAAGAGPSC